MVTVPRLVIGAPASGHGKTTIATGMMAALRRAGLRVSGHKVGPDFIDPSYHSLATGRPPRNLDPYLQGEQLLGPLLRHGAESADIAVIEGVMGLFDGALNTQGYASTAHVARLLDAPVVLVVDASAASRSVAALVLGFAGYDPRIRLAGVILNKLGSARHEEEIRAALEPTGIPVLGALRRQEDIHAPSRHLGLVPVGERRGEALAMLDRLAQWVRGGVDLAALERVARGAPALTAARWVPAEALSTAEAATGGAEALSRAEAMSGRGARPVVAAAAGEAFTFRYTETTELLVAAGIDVVDIDPVTDEALPAECAGMYLGGGFPEVHADALAANASLRARVGDAVRAGVPVAAECAGLVYLCSSVDGLPMVGLLDASATMTTRGSLGYRTARAPADNLLAVAGTEVTGHEFHRTEVTPARSASPAWEWDGDHFGFADMSVHASYLHVHWAGYPALARRFADAVRRTASKRSAGGRV